MDPNLTPYGAAVYAGSAQAAQAPGPPRPITLADRVAGLELSLAEALKAIRQQQEVIEVLRAFIGG